MEQASKPKPDQKAVGRLNNLRKFISTPEDAELVKEMIADGLDDSMIMEAMGHPAGLAPSNQVLPEGHEHSHKMTTEQQEKEEAKAAGLGQPGEDGSGEAGRLEEGDEEEDPMSHLVALLGSMGKGKAKNRKKGGATGGNSR